MKIKDITTKQPQQCFECRENIPTGTKAIARHKWSELSNRAITKWFCDEICISIYQDKRQQPVNKMLNRLQTQFN